MSTFEKTLNKSGFKDQLIYVTVSAENQNLNKKNQNKNKKVL